METLEDVIARLGVSTVENKTDLTMRLELARLVGKRVVSSTALSFIRAGRPRIIDVFRYNGEQTMLEMRLSEMGDWVDYFVVVEAGITFTRLPKPLYFNASKEAFARYRDKIVHLVVEDFPDFLTAPWAVEFWQRDCALRALSGMVARDDVVFLSDVDEIVRKDAVRAFTSEMAGLTMDTFFLFLNRRKVNACGRQSPTGAICRASMLERRGMSDIRYALARAPGAPRIHDAGWHFTSVATPVELAVKMKSYSHLELSERGSHDAAYFEKKRRRARTKASANWEQCPLSDLPQYVSDNEDRLRELLM
jgi:hypothetical protein